MHPHDPSQIRTFALTLAPALGDGPVSCEPWREGASNSVWRLDIGPLQAVLKIGKLSDWRRLGVEAAALRAIDGQGAPRVLAHGEADAAFPWDWSVLERIQGHHPYDLDAPAAAELGRTLMALRQVQFPSLAMGTWRTFLAERIQRPLDTTTAAPTAWRDRFAALVRTTQSLADHGDALDALPVGVVHGDIIPLNLVEQPNGRLWVLDWENPRRGSLAWDLAGIRKAFKLGEGAWDALLSTLEPVPESALDFADALQQMQVAAWRLETWWGRENHDAGPFFLEELDQELEKAKQILATLPPTSPR